MRRKARPGGGKQLEVRVEALGARGDGLARHEGRPLYLAQALPGDLVRVRLVGKQAGGFRGEVMELLEEGPGPGDAALSPFRALRRLQPAAPGARRATRRGKEISWPRFWRARACRRMSCRIY